MFVLRMSQGLGNLFGLTCVGNLVGNFVAGSLPTAHSVPEYVTGR